MLINIFHSNIENLCVFLLLGICILMLLAPLYSWKYRPSKSLTKRILVTLCLIPIFLYFLSDMFHAIDIQKNNILLLNFDKSTESVLLRDSDHIEMSNEYTFASEHINERSNNEEKIIEEEGVNANYDIIYVSESMDSSN
ncbi:hypothetical protein [Psychrobacter aquimaris]|uniref:hypothetical protein n=1 Tax=Psychrobacter aquimaris TaxID=292733 RepID=UPI003FD5B20B